MSSSEIHVAPVIHETLEERIYRELVDLILDGAISPGEWITIQSLAQGFRVSATPVREALKRLCAANALQVVSGRSIGIPPLTIERLTDLRNVRIEVEGVATEWATVRSTPDMIARLEHELERMDAAIASEDVAAYLRGNRAFHFTIYNGCGSPVLLSTIEVLWLQISPYFNLLRTAGYISSNVRHKAIAAALKKGDGPKARLAMCDDIDTAYKTLSKLLGV